MANQQRCIKNDFIAVRKNCIRVQATFFFVFYEL